MRERNIVWMTPIPSNAPPGAAARSLVVRTTTFQTPLPLPTKILAALGFGKVKIVKKALVAGMVQRA